MNIFLDTNILIDIICEREGYENGSRILALSEHPQYQLYTSVLTMANMVYILRKILKGDLLYQTLNTLSQRLQISPMTEDTFCKAMSLKATDFEDSLQYFSALSVQCTAIITRNKKDFYFSNIPVYSPEEFLQNSL